MVKVDMVNHRNDLVQNERTQIRIASRPLHVEEARQVALEEVRLEEEQELEEEEEEEAIICCSRRPLFHSGMM